VGDPVLVIGNGMYIFFTSGGPKVPPLS